MANIPLSVPFQFRRTSNTPLDYTSVVSTTTELNNLSATATSYLGMQVFNVEDQTLYVLITSSTNSDPHFYALGGNNSSAGQQASTQLETVSSDLADQIANAQTTAFNNLTSLSSDVYGAVGEALAQQISALSAFDTITELAAAVDSLSSYKTSSNFLSASNPTITSGDLTLANSFGIKVFGDTTVIDSNRNVIANTLYVGPNTSSALKIDSTGIFAAAEYYIKTDGVAKVGALTAASLDLGGSGAITNAGAIGAQTVTATGEIKGLSLSASDRVSGNELSVATSLTAGAGNFIVDNTGAITKVAGITSQGNINAQSYNISTTGTVEATTLSASGSVRGNDLSLTQGITSSSENFKVDASGNVTAASLTINGGTYKIESTGDAKLKGLTVDSINNNGALSAASGKFVVDSTGNVTVGESEASPSNLTVTGNLSVLGDITYLDTKVTTMSAISAVLNSDSATTLQVQQLGSFPIATFGNSTGTKVQINSTGSLSATQAATFDSTVNVGGKLTVNADISSSQTVYASAAQFSSILEVGSQGDATVLYVNASGVGINTETLDGYSLKVSGDSDSGNGTLYVAGSAAFGSYATFESTGGEVATSGSGSTKTISLTGNKRAVNWETMWTYISALDGGSF